MSCLIVSPTWAKANKLVARSGHRKASLQNTHTHTTAQIKPHKIKKNNNTGSVNTTGMGYGPIWANLSQIYTHTDRPKAAKRPAQQ